MLKTKQETKQKTQTSKHTNNNKQPTNHIPKFIIRITMKVDVNTEGISRASCRTRALQKSLPLNEQKQKTNTREFSGRKTGERTTFSSRNDKTARKGKRTIGTRDEIGTRNQMTALRFQTGGDLFYIKILIWVFIQGSVIAPVLFTILIHNLPKALTKKFMWHNMQLILLFWLTQSK